MSSVLFEKRRFAIVLLFAVCLLVLAWSGVPSSPAQPSDSANAGIAIHYPEDRSIFPPDIIAPSFQWGDTSGAAVWRVSVLFSDGSSSVLLWSQGEKFELGEIDQKLVGYVPPEMTPDQKVAHTWRPDENTWQAIKKHSVKQPATVVIEGFRSKSDQQPISRGQMQLQTSIDPVGAPLLFRDVPLIPPPIDQERGIIKPLPDFAIPQIKWQLRSVSEPKSKVLMDGLPTCANCHSFSSDGKTMGLDVDGPGNDKGLYAMLPIHKVSTINNDYVIHWADYSDPDVTAQKRFGAMSQVSPDGKYVVTSIEVPGSHGQRGMDRMYNTVYPFYGFMQVFYPTRGVLAWYKRDSGEFHTLPGAADPEYVHAGAFWSPDGKYLVFSRAKAKDPYYPGQVRSKYANDPNERQIQYDLYRIPFNNGTGGKAERVVGASENGMSNNFPKVSPDGKWIVFVQNKNGFLMRPDSLLYIVPFEGGTARRLNCNQKIMNSWHSFSPNGRWLAFASKSPNYYTKLYLTHIDKDGNDSPAILVENATAANRAVNIPEFVNIPSGGLEHIDTPALDFYRVFEEAGKLSNQKKFDQAIKEWKKAVELAPDDARAHSNYGIALMEVGQLDDSISEFRRSLQLNGSSSQTSNNLGIALAQKGAVDEALSFFTRAVELNPDNASAQTNLGTALLSKKNRVAEALDHLRKGVELQPDSATGQNTLGVALARAQLLEEGAEHLRLAVSLAPDSPDYHYNLGRALAAQGAFPAALPEFEKAVNLSRSQDPTFMQMLAAMYSETGRYSDAVLTARKALELAQQQQNLELADSLQANLTLYESKARSAGVVLNPGTR